MTGASPTADARPIETILPPRDLTVPEPGSQTLAEILNAWLRTTVRAWIASPPPGLPAARAREAEAMRRSVGELLRREPGLVFSLARRPTLSTLIHCAQGASGDLEARTAELCQTTFFDLALAERLPAPQTVAGPVTRLCSLEQGLAVACSPPARSVRFSSERIELSFDDGAVAIPLPPAAVADPRIAVRRPYLRWGERFALALVDNNPLAMLEAHPDKQGNAVDLGGCDAEEWLGVLGEAFALVARHLPALATEMELCLEQVVPVGYDAERHVSASYREAIGTVYLSLHPNLLTMTEALIHEFQHNKLNALFSLDPVLHNAFAAGFASPVRPDPRPLHGVLLAVHAFQPVARLYEEMERAGDPRLVRPDVRRRWREVIDGNHAGCEVLLANAEPTPVGAALLEEIGRWDAHFGQIDPGPA